VVSNTTANRRLAASIKGVKNMTINKPMITIITVAALAVLSTSQVMAQQVTPEYARAQSVTSTATRADVKAAYTAFRATGEPSFFSREFSNRTQTVATSVPRATVKAETLRALRNDEVINAGEVPNTRSASTPSAVRLAALGR
jgi:hypothetical protein